MAPFYFMLALLVQSSLCYADDVKRNETESIELVPEVDDSQSNVQNADDEILSNSYEEKFIVDGKNTSSKIDVQDVLAKDFRTATDDWVDLFIGSNSDSSSSAVSKMAQVANSNKSPEEQLKEIKEVASEMSLAIETDFTNLLSYALNIGDKDGEDNKLRKRRSVETPMDSSQLVMNLLNHIKCFNEHTNIAIEKMMTAQEIADKYGVEFNPDPEILTDLAYAANEQAKELTSILEEACNTNNSSCVANNSTMINQSEDSSEIYTPLNTTYYVFASEYPDGANFSTAQGPEHTFQPTWDKKHVHYGENHAGYNYYNHHCENQIPPPPVQHSYECSVTPKPTFYDSISYNPNEYYTPYCSVDPMGFYPVYAYDDPLDLEPELVGEEYEETVSSKVIIEQDEEPGSATVNHVMTYTLSEKAHFRTPQIEQLPQQVQYYFLLM